MDSWEGGFGAKGTMCLMGAGSLRGKGPFGDILGRTRACLPIDILSDSFGGGDKVMQSHASIAVATCFIC